MRIGIACILVFLSATVAAQPHAFVDAISHDLCLDADGNPMRLEPGVIHDFDPTDVPGCQLVFGSDEQYHLHGVCEHHVACSNAISCSQSVDVQTVAGRPSYNGGPFLCARNPSRLTTLSLEVPPSACTDEAGVPRKLMSGVVDYDLSAHEDCQLIAVPSLQPNGHVQMQYRLEGDCTNTVSCANGVYCTQGVTLKADSQRGLLFEGASFQCMKPSVHVQDDAVQTLINWDALSMLRESERQARLFSMTAPTSAHSMLVGPIYNPAQRSVDQFISKTVDHYYQWNLYYQSENRYADFINRHAPYCRVFDTFYGLCPENLDHLDKPMADLSAAHFYAPLTYLPEAIPGAFAYIRNATNPMPFDRLMTELMYHQGQKENGFTAMGLEHWAVRLQQQALLSLPQYVMLNAMAKRMPQKDMARLIEIPGTEPTDLERALLAMDLPVTAGMGGFTEEQQRDVNTFYREASHQPGVLNPDMSLLGLQHYESLKRYTSADWYLTMAKSSTEALLREWANMRAFTPVMELEANRSLERIEALMSVQLLLDAQARGRAQVGLEVGQSGGEESNELGQAMDRTAHG